MTPLKNRIALTMLALTVAVSCHKSEKASGFVQAVEATKPIAYYRLESTSGTSETGGSAYSSTNSVSNSAGAPIGVSGNLAADLNGKDGAITTTQKGGIATAGSMMAWVKLAALPSKTGHIVYVAGISQSGNDFDLQFEEDGALRFFTSAGG